MGDLLREMCAEYESGAHKSNEEAMRAALLHLSYNVTDEMLRDMHDAWIEWSGQDSGRWEYCLKAALRAAAGGGDK